MQFACEKFNGLYTEKQNSAHCVANEPPKKKGRPIDKRKKYLVRGAELLGTTPQKPDSKQNCGDNVETSTRKETPIASITPCHTASDCGGDTVQQCEDDTNNSNEGHVSLLYTGLSSKVHFLFYILHSKQDSQTMAYFLA